jgi:hypothetical protein
MNSRRFPPLWSVEEQAACYVVRNHGGQKLAYIYFEDEPGRRPAAKLLDKAFPRRTTPTSDARTAWPIFSGRRSTISRAYRRTDIAFL